MSWRDPGQTESPLFPRPTWELKRLGQREKSDGTEDRDGDETVSCGEAEVPPNKSVFSDGDSTLLQTVDTDSAELCECGEGSRDEEEVDGYSERDYSDYMNGEEVADYYGFLYKGSGYDPEC